MKWPTPTSGTGRALRIARIVVQTALALWLARRGIQFYYQGF
jgi:hypothetical protein